MPKLRIDNREIEVPAGATVLEAAASAGIEIPALCHFPGKPAQTSCLVCVVKVNGSPRLLPACATRATEGMVVENSSVEVRAARKTALELILGDHLGDCVGPCVSVCPAHMDIPEMLRLVSENKLREAVAKVKERIPLPATLGRTCPELCERGCRRTPHDGAVSICMVKRFVGDSDLASESPYLPEKAPPTGKKVAIVGAGATGLSAAWYLLQHGHGVSIFDDHESFGGSLRYGTGNGLLPDDVLDAEAGLIFKLGAEFNGHQTLGRDFTLAQLRSQFDAVLLACGEVLPENAQRLGVPYADRGVKVNRKTFQTADPAVFAAGSIVTPLKHDVYAVGAGRVAADAIAQYLAGKPIEVEDNPYSVHAGSVEGEALQAFLKFGTPAVRTQAEKKTGLTPEQARTEGERCLQCGCCEPGGCRLRRYATEYGANQARFRGERALYTRDESHPEISYEEGKCIKCGLCVQVASEFKEKLGLAFIGRGFDVRIAVPFNEALREGLKKAARACAAACPTRALSPKRKLP
jgi:NADPH-dependent glutamate synthase beta subunit-like oxidoreductase/ferredoxin